MKYFKSHSEFLNEAKLSAIHKAAKKGSYPVTVVVVSNGSVTKQEIVNTPAAVPAVFNELQKEYPGATINIESKTGQTLFVESVVNEKLARGLKPLLKTGSTITKKVGEDALLDLSDKFDRIDDEYAGTIASWLDMAIELMQDGYAGDATKKLKQFNKACKDVLNGKDIGSAFESTITEGKFNKRSLMRAMKKDDGMIQLSNGQEYVIYNPNNGNDDNTDMWQDKVIFGLDKDGEEHEIEYSDIVSYNEGRKINLKQDHLSSEEYQMAKKLKAFDKEDWEWNSKSGLYDRINEAEDYKYKKYVSKAFDKISDAMFEFRNAMGVKQLGQADPKLKKRLEAIQTELLALRREMKSEGLTESEVNEATDLNDPVLVAYRATSRDLPKLKIPKLKSRRLSFDKYMDLLDARLDIDQQIKDLRDEMAQTLRDMEQEAEPEGGEVADRYGSTMMKQEKEYTKLMAKKDKIMARIDKHRMA